MLIHFCRCVSIVLFSVAILPAQDFNRDRIQAPVAPPPPLKGEGKPKAEPKSASGAQYFIGDPTDEEQFFLELINRARQDPSAEAARLLALNQPNVLTALQQFHVDTNLMVAQFAAYAQAPPLSFNAKLNNAARGHTSYLLTQGVQEHNEYASNRVDLLNTLADRYRAVEYSYSGGSENLYSYMDDVEQGHASFEVDWGDGPTAVGGMQNPPGHRDNTHDLNGLFVEVGIGVLHGSNSVGPHAPVGPMLVTVDFARPLSPMTFITGVAYCDLNGNDFYDLGEGLSNVTVTADGLSAFAVTTAAGGYSIPAPPNQAFTVRFNPVGGSEVIAAATTASARNFKVDFKSGFTPETITSLPSPITVGALNPIGISKLVGATGYRARSMVATAPSVEGGETLTNITLNLFGRYALSPTTPLSGAKGFHLAHITDTSGSSLKAYPQILQFNAPYHVKAGAEIRFKSRLNHAALGESAKVEVSSDDGVAWVTVFSQAGVASGPVETSATTKTINLGAFAGQVVLIRFNYDVDLSQGWYNLNSVPSSQSDQIGWIFDDVTFANMDLIMSTATSDIDLSATYNFDPPTPGNYLLQFRALNGARTFPWNLVQTVTAEAANPETQPPILVDAQYLTPDSIRLTVSGVAGFPYVIQTSTDLNIWSSMATNTSPFHFTNSFGPGIPARFFRSVYLKN